jgi:MFS family permease
MEELTRLDRLPFARWHLALVVVLGVSWIFDGFEVSSLSLCSSSIKTSLNIENSQYYIISSCYLAGCAIGGLAFGFLSFFIGRKQIFIVQIIKT